MSNYTPRAHQALAIARKEADRFNQCFICTEHLLLGLLALGSGVQFNVLSKLGLTLETVRAEVEKQVGPGPAQKVIGNIPYTPRVMEVLAVAANEAKNLSHTYVGTEHILLGLLKMEGGVAAQVFKAFGVDVKKTCLEILQELTPQSSANLIATESAKSDVASLDSTKLKRTWGNITPRAQRVLTHARIEADGFHHGFVSSEHLLLGILRLGNGPGFDVLTKSGLTLAKVREEVEKEVGACPDQIALAQLPLAPRVNKILEAAAKEAKTLHHAYFGTEHILLALLSEGDGVVPIVLKKLGVDIERTCAELLQALTPPTSTGDLPPPTESEKLGFFRRWFSKENPGLINFTPRAQQALWLARKEADRFNHNFVGTEALLLGLIKLNQGVAVSVLRKLGLDLETVRAEVEKQVGTGPDQKMIGNIPYTPRVKRVLALASKEAKNLNHTYVGTEHILLGLLLEGDGVAARVLKSLDVNVEQTRLEILKELDPNFAGSSGHSIETSSTKPDVPTVPSAPSGEAPGDSTTPEPEPTPRAQDVLKFAREEAERLKTDSIGPEHILIGLIGVGRGIAFDVLLVLRLNLAEARSEVEKQVGVGQITVGNMGYNHRGKAVLALAVEEAKALRQSFIGTEHLLLGLLRQEDGVVPQALKNLGVDPAKVRADVLKEIERIFGK